MKNPKQLCGSEREGPRDGSQPTAQLHVFSHRHKTTPVCVATQPKSSPLLVSTEAADAGAELEAVPAASAAASAGAASAACCEECPFRLK